MQNTNPKKSAVMERIAKLLSLANDASASPGEKANAMNHVRRLMEAENLNSRDLAYIEAGATEVVTEAAYCSKSRNLDLWERQLALAVGHTFDCLPVIGISGNTARGHNTIKFMGQAKDIAVATAAWLSLRADMMKMACAATRGLSGDLRTPKKEYLSGYAVSLLKAARESYTSNPEKKQAIQAYADGKTRPGRKMSLAKSDMTSAGLRDGATARLNRNQVTPGAVRLMIA